MSCLGAVSRIGELVIVVTNGDKIYGGELQSHPARFNVRRLAAWLLDSIGRGRLGGTAICGLVMNLP